MNHNKKNAASPAYSADSAKTKHCSHQVRIIGGVWKRTPLTVITAEGLRPTPDRVRETVFNWINHLVHGNWESLRCLDLFAGSGALGFEAASRGAEHVLSVESFTPAFRQLEEVKAKLKAENLILKRADALLLINQLLKNGERYDVIFLDPPFNQGYLQKVLPLCADLLTESGLLYVEAEQALPMPYGDENSTETADWCAGWQVVRSDTAGSVAFQILQRS